jgi:hypothetical protein
MNPRLLVLTATVGVLVGCDNGTCRTERCEDNGPDPITGQDAGVVDAGSNVPTGPAIKGFNLTVKNGTWWKFRDVYNLNWGSGSQRVTTTFVLMLGDAVSVSGRNWYLVNYNELAYDCTGSSCGDPSPGWKYWSDTGSFAYLSFDDGRIMASRADDGSWSVLFDANTGIWPATSYGMFANFENDTGTRKAFADGLTWKVEDTSFNDDCTSVPGYGTLCGGSGISSGDGYEVWDPAIGLVSSGSQGNSSNGSNQETYTLLDSSVDGSRPVPTQ